MLSQDLRPQTWAEIAGQELVKVTMKAVINNPDAAPRSIVFSGAYGTGKCVTEDVRVYTEDGYLPISKLYKNPKEGFNDFKTKVYTRYGWKDTSHFYYERNCKVYNIELDNGSIIKGTDKHRVLAYNKDTGVPELMRMDSLGIGSYVFKNSKIEDSGKEISDPDLAFALGMISASGRKKGNYFTVCGTKYELDIVNSYLQSNNKYISDNRLEDTHYLKVSNNEFISKYFSSDFDLDSKYIPEIIWNMDIKSRVSYIQGLFMTKGYILQNGSSKIDLASKKYLDDISSRNNYSFTCRCKKFVYELSELSDSLGLFYRVGEGKKVNRHTYYNITYKHHLKNTSDTLRLISSKYMDSKFLCPKPLDSMNDRNIFPVSDEIISNYESFYKNANYKSRHLENMKRCRRITERTILKLKNEYSYHNDKLDSFVGLYSTKVKKIWFTYEDVYDLTVPEVHEFIAQGIANHNTTSCRIFAKALNCPNKDKQGNPCNKPDCHICSQDMNQASFYVEYDSSVIGNVDKIRELRDTFYYTTDNMYKVIVLDESHVVSKQAQTAFLKVLEEAPRGVFFIFATTHPQQLLPTILSRSLEIKVTKVPMSDIENNIKLASERLGIEITDDIIKLIAHKSKGHMRNCHMLLDLYCLVGEEAFKSSVKSARESLAKYMIAIAKKNTSMLFQAIDELQAFPVADIKDDLDTLLLDMMKALVDKDDSTISKLAQTFNIHLLKLIKNVSSDWVKNSFSDDISAQTALLALYQLITEGMITKTKTEVRGK